MERVPKKRHVSATHNTSLIFNAKSVEAFLLGLGDPDVVWSCTRVNTTQGGPPKRCFLRTGVKTISSMCTNHTLMTKSQHFAAIGLKSNSQISKVLFERFMAACICNVKEIDGTNNYVLSDTLISRLQVKPRLGHPNVVMDWTSVDRENTTTNPASPPTRSTNTTTFSPP